MKKLFFALLLGAALLLTACGAGEAKPASAQTDASQGTVMDTAVTAAPSEESIVQRASLIELLDWIREYVTIATAGSSLRSARAAAELLDWAADCTLTEEELAAVYAAWQPAQKEEYPADVTEQLSAVDYAVQMLTGDDSQEAAGLLSDAGCEDCGYPWDAHARETVDALMHAAGVR